MSFRARLTLSYTIFAAVLLTFVTAVLVGCVTFLSTRPIAAGVERTAERIQRVVDEDRKLSPDAVAADVRRLNVPSGVIVRVTEPPGAIVRFGYGPLLHVERRPFDVLFRIPKETDGPGLQRPVGRGFHVYGTGPRPGIDLRLAALWMRPHVIALAPGYDAFIAPDLRQVAAILTLVGWSFPIALVLTLFAAWAIGRWIAAQAVAPLIAIAGEMRRFAAGDFTPRVLAARDRSEIGDLVTAYNGAAAQVAAAFEERARVEQHMRRFLGEAGHEMRTPLTVISGYLDVLERGGYDSPNVRLLALPTMRVETRRLRALVERLMTLARLEGDHRGHAEIVDVVVTAQDAIAETTAARGGTVRLHADGDHVVFAEPTEVYEAIINLIDNALKYGAGSPVDVVIDGDENGTTVRVTDHGPGITEADRARLFERFFRGEAANGIEGSGLGLAIVARAAERSRGTVTLESHDPGWTTFRLTFPPFRTPQRDQSVILLG